MDMISNNTLVDLFGTNEPRLDLCLCSWDPACSFMSSVVDKQITKKVQLKDFFFSQFSGVEMCQENIPHTITPPPPEPMIHAFMLIIPNSDPAI